MTAGKVRIDPAGVRSAGAKVGHAGEDFASRASALANALAAEGACWGGDESGQKFAKDYVPAADGIRDAMAKVAEALQAIGESLVGTADVMEQQDTFNANGLSG